MNSVFPQHFKSKWCFIIFFFINSFATSIYCGYNKLISKEIKQKLENIILLTVIVNLSTVTNTRIIL